jgi:hypothetical protein
VESRTPAPNHKRVWQRFKPAEIRRLRALDDARRHHQDALQSGDESAAMLWENHIAGLETLAPVDR